MNIFKKRLSKKVKLQILLAVIAFIAIVLLLVLDIIYKGPLTTLLSDRQKITDTVKSFGIFAPLIYIILQILQTVAAPIPGQLVGLVGGILFGWWGVLWTVIGSAIGFFIVFSLSRKFGRSLVEKIVKKEHLDKFDFIAGKHAPIILFSIFTMPGFPDDIVCYLAGLTSIPIKQLMVMIVVGRLPAVIMTNIFGDSLGEKNFTALILISIIALIMISIVFIFRKSIMNFLKKLSQDS